MRIERLRLTGFRGANETEIKFSEGLTLLKETDGGRSVLDAVLIAAGAFLRQMPFCDGCTFRHIDGEGAGLDAVFAGQGDSRMGISRRAFIASDGRLKTTTRDAAALRELAMKCRRLQYDKSAVLPLVAFNGARRRWGWRCGVGETNWMRMDRLSVFSDACHPDVGVGMFAQWFVDLWYSMNDQRLKRMQGSILLDPPRLALYEAHHKAVCDAVDGCLRTAEVEGLEYDPSTPGRWLRATTAKGRRSRRCRATRWPSSEQSPTWPAGAASSTRRRPTERWRRRPASSSLTGRESARDGFPRRWRRCGGRFRTSSSSWPSPTAWRSSAGLRSQPYDGGGQG